MQRIEIAQADRDCPAPAGLTAGGTQAEIGQDLGTMTAAWAECRARLRKVVGAVDPDP